MKPLLLLIVISLALSTSGCSHRHSDQGLTLNPPSLSVVHTAIRTRPPDRPRPRVMLMPPWPAFVAAAQCGGQPANSLQVLGSPTMSSFGYDWVSDQGWDLHVSVDSRTKRVSEIKGMYGPGRANTVADIISAMGLDGKPYRAYMFATSYRGDQWLTFDVAYLQPGNHVLVISGICEPDLLQSVTDFNTGKVTYSLSPLFSLRVARGSGIFWGVINPQDYDPGDADINWTVPKNGAGAPAYKEKWQPFSGR